MICDCAVRKAPSSSEATTTCFGFTMVTQWASGVPLRLVLMSATTAPMRVSPSQKMKYSGRFSMKRQTASPFLIPCASAQRAYWLARASSCL